MPVTQALSMPPISETSQWALNSISPKCRSGNRSGTPPPTSWHMSWLATKGWPMNAWVNIRSEASRPSIAMLACIAMSVTDFIVEDSGSSTFTPPVAVWKNTGVPLAWAAAHTGSKFRE